MNEKNLRKHLAWLIQESEAHVEFEKAVAGLPPKLRGVVPEGAMHSAWDLLEHMRIAQWDIVEFSYNPTHRSPSFPEGYWPESSTPPNAKAWQESVAAFRRDRKTMVRLVTDPKTDLFTPIPHGTGQTVLREAMLLADHNSYHIGELVFLRRLLGAWKT